MNQTAVLACSSNAVQMTPLLAFITNLGLVLSTLQVGHQPRCNPSCPCVTSLKRPQPFQRTAPPRPPRSSQHLCTVGSLHLLQCPFFQVNPDVQRGFTVKVMQCQHQPSIEPLNYCVLCGPWRKWRIRVRWSRSHLVWRGLSSFVKTAFPF